MLVRLGVWGALLQPSTAGPEPTESVPSVVPEVEPAPDPAPISAPATSPEPAPIQRAAPRESARAAPQPPPPQSQPAVADAAWDALVGRNVVIETGGGAVEGELIESEGNVLVVVRADGSVSTTPKSAATSVRVVQSKSPPRPTAQPSSAEADIAALETPDEEEEASDEDEDEDLTEGQKRRKERREQREHALLGAFAMHGATYTHWRGDGVNSGHASYAMDWGVGFNFSKSFGLYAIAGGLLGAKIDGGDTKANYGRVGGVFAFGGKWYYTTVGAGAAFSRLRFEDGTLQKDRGLAIPSRLMLRIPVPKKLYVGIGLTYEFAAVRNFGRYINAVGGQLVFGRW